MTTKPTSNPDPQSADKESVPAVAAAAKVDTHDGTLISISGDCLVMSDKESHNRSFRVAGDAFVCCDRVICRLEDLKTGNKIRLTTLPEGADVATKIESLDNQIDFADHH